MDIQTIRMLTKAWYGDEEVSLALPARWEVEECRMEGHDAPAATDDHIREALANPIGSARLREMARGKKQVVILFDDLTRPTPTWRIIPFVLEELAAAGIADNQIRFVAAFANHAPMNLESFTKKLGKDVVRRFCVYNHNPFDHLVDLGKTRRGTPVLINKEVMDCDLKIGIGALTSHFAVGFSGGAKLVLPGVAGLESADHNHRVLAYREGKMFGEEAKQDMQEAARMVGLDMKVDVILNQKREVVKVFAGDFVEEYNAGVEVAKKFYATPIAKDCDILICNAYPSDNIPFNSAWPINLSLKEGGYMVLVAHSVEGIPNHYLSGRFGTNHGGRMWMPIRFVGAKRAKRLLLYFSEYSSRSMLDQAADPSRVVHCDTWAEAVIHLMQEYGNQEKVKVGVYPYAQIQLPREA